MAAPVAAPAPCDGVDGLALVAPPPIPARWDHHRSYAGRGELEVHWCGDGSIEVRQLSTGPAARWVRTYAAGVAVARRGAPARLAIDGASRPGLAPITVVAVDDTGAERRGTVDVASVDDPARSAAIAACTACGGAWGPVGIMSTETCDCPTADAGQPCTSRADCESVCIATGWIAAAAGTPSTCAAGEQHEVLAGRCHDRQHAFGCRARLGERRDRCVRPDRRHHDVLPRVCAD
ncbi:MAG: hypothetical protein R3B06_05005 [Kofleriaceae bacterium]